jgi:hypothetical protein
VVVPLEFAIAHRLTEIEDALPVAARRRKEHDVEAVVRVFRDNGELEQDISGEPASVPQDQPSSTQSMSAEGSRTRRPLSKSSDSFTSFRGREKSAS